MGLFSDEAVGVGIGPFNLSVAALAHPVKELRTRFFDRRPEFQWHPGLLFPEVTIQVSYLKDLVTLADPTSPFSFLAYLASSRRLYRFINAGFGRVLRREFNQYMRWAAGQLPELEFGRTVRSVVRKGDALLVDVDGETVPTRNLVVATGPVPRIPGFARPHVGSTVFHASRFLEMFLHFGGKRVAVVGGGQTGAEIVSHLLADSARLPAELLWITRRPNFQPIDESPFSNELFTPAYSNHFFHLAPEVRRRLAEEQKLASDGISPELLGQIYQRLYQLEFLDGKRELCGLLPGREMTGLHRDGKSWRIDLSDRMTGIEEQVGADIVVLCTGYQAELPPCLAGLAGEIPPGEIRLQEDYSIEWAGSPQIRIYVQNSGVSARGVADPNLSLMAWRSAKIVNSLAGRTVYDTEENSCPFVFPLESTAARQEGAVR